MAGSVSPCCFGRFQLELLGCRLAHGLSAVPWTCDQDCGNFARADLRNRAGTCVATAAWGWNLAAIARSICVNHAYLPCGRYGENSGVFRAQAQIRCQHIGHRQLTPCRTITRQ